MFVSKFHEYDADVDGFSGGNVQSGEFSFGSRSHDMFDDMCYVENGAIIGWDVCIGRKEEVAACSAASFGFAKVAGVTVSGKDHFAGVISEYCFFLCR